MLDYNRGGDVMLFFFLKEISVHKWLENLFQ